MYRRYFLWISSLGMPLVALSSPSRRLSVQSTLTDQSNYFEETAHIFDIRPQFESPEHTSIGDQVLLRFPSDVVKGADFGFQVNNSNLSFGNIIALAGDFYYKWRIGPCEPSISDDWTTDQEKSLEVAASNVKLLRTDSPGMLECVLPIIESQGQVTRDAQSRGQDIAQAYRAVEDDYNYNKYPTCGLGYGVIALCNADHFGDDARKAYSSVHTLALRKAQEASRTKKENDLREAYFIEGFAQHYLTDMFSSGHIRTPRRLLHSTSPTLDIYPGDKCCKAQHDEDCANGLWVTNAEGDSWAAYGDKQLGQGRSGKNRQMVTSASQAGVDEIYETYKSGQIATSSDFKALKKTPILEKTLGVTNSVPLFEKNPQGSDSMLFRQNIDQRAIAQSRKKVMIPPSNEDWVQYLDAIKGSGSSKNMYVYSRSFVSDQKLLHLGRMGPGSSDVVTNLYGPVDAGKYGQYWGMAGQGVGNLGVTQKKRRWIDSQLAGDGVVSLVAREYASGGKTSALHVGYGFDARPNGQLSLKVLWNQTVDDGNSDRVSGEVLYGCFSENCSTPTMAKYFAGLKADSRVEFWSMPAKLNESPKQFASPINTTKLNFLLSHKMHQSDSFSTLVGYQTGPLSTSVGAWYFCSWTGDYDQMQLTTISEPNSGPAQALLSDPSSDRLVRLYYGKRYPTVQTLRLDIMLPGRNDTDGQVYFKEQPSSQEFPISWQAYDEQDYLLWFMHDVNGNGHADLVAYTSDASNLFLNVIVFPARADGTFDNPVVSRIVLDPQVGTLLTAEFMQPLYTAQTTYTYPHVGTKTSGAIISFFDNYGIIAARVIAPEASHGSYRYELKGQDGAIAGQRSFTIEERPKDWMGLRRKTQGIGIVPV